jgi:hypothetical protein
MNKNIYTGDAIADMSLGIKKRGCMRPGAYEAELIPRGPESPDIIGLDEKIERIAKGQNTGIFQNPQELASSLKGFESWCKRKNVVPSYAGIAVYLSCSKSTVLKYMKDTAEYSIFIIHDNIEDKDIYSTTKKEYLDKYIAKSNIAERDNATGKNVTYSMQSKIDNGEYNVLYRTTSFAQVMEPVCNLVELVTTNKAWTMKNPSWPIWLSKNKFGATEHYTDEQQIAIKPANPLDDMSDEQILKAAQSLPDDEDTASKK